MAWIDQLTQNLEEELKDTIKYSEFAKYTDGPERQMLRDIAKEEFGHAKHLCEIMRRHGIGHNLHELWERARAAL